MRCGAPGNEVRQFVVHVRRILNGQRKSPILLVGIQSIHGKDLRRGKIEKGGRIGQRQQCLARALSGKVGLPPLEPERACALSEFKAEKLFGYLAVRLLMQRCQHLVQLLHGDPRTRERRWTQPGQQQKKYKSTHCMASFMLRIIIATPAACRVPNPFRALREKRWGPTSSSAFGANQERNLCAENF